jgi:hypothetical protein
MKILAMVLIALFVAALFIFIMVHDVVESALREWSRKHE